MRRNDCRGEPALGYRLLEQAATVEMASTDEAGAPMLKTVHGVVHRSAIYFHSAPAGEKCAAVGRPAVISTHRTVGQIPSYFRDPQRACPATTYFESVQVHGVLEPLTDPTLKATVLQKLMEKLQPEGGYLPITHDHKLYRAAVKGIAIAGVSLDNMSVKVKLGQNLKPDQRAGVLENLWRRGAIGDCAAIDAIMAHNPETPTPPFLQQAPEGASLRCFLDRRHLDQAIALVKDAYWNTHHNQQAIALAHIHSNAWVGATDADGRLIATARALSDEGKVAWIYDVAVAEDWRQRGLGQAVMHFLLDHPRVRSASKAILATRDAGDFYKKFGFLPCRPAPYPRHVLERQRAASDR